MLFVLFLLGCLLVWGVPFDASFWAAFSARERRLFLPRAARCGLRCGHWRRRLSPGSTTPQAASRAALPANARLVLCAASPPPPAVLLAFSFIFQTTITNI